MAVSCIIKIVIVYLLSSLFTYCIFIILRDKDRAHRLNSCGLDEYWDRERMQRAINEMKKEIYGETEQDS